MSPNKPCHACEHFHDVNEECLTVENLKAKVETLESELEEKNIQIDQLQRRIEELEALKI